MYIKKYTQKQTTGE